MRMRSAGPEANSDKSSNAGEFCGTLPLCHLQRVSTLLAVGTYPRLAKSHVQNNIRHAAIGISCSISAFGRQSRETPRPAEAAGKALVRRSVSREDVRDSRSPRKAGAKIDRKSAG